MIATAGTTIPARARRPRKAASSRRGSARDCGSRSEFIMPFRRLKIGTRIYLGSGVSVVLALAVLGFGLLQFWSVRDHNRAEAVLAASMERVLEASHELETVRRAETHYRLD